jgi:ketosteroid isomerase-like protein
VPVTPQEIFERHLRAGAFGRDPDAVAELFAPDGVYEAPFATEPFPRRLAGRAEIRDGLAALYRTPLPDWGAVDTDKTRYVLHLTTDPDTFIVEIDTVFTSGETMSLVQIFRVSDGRITLLRDYFG